MYDPNPIKVPTQQVADIELPREFEKLYELAYNLWWTWTPAARRLFSTIDPAKWERYRNPVELLINVDPRHWYGLLAHESFVAKYHAVTDALDDYMHPTEPPWFHRAHGREPDGPMAYFSMEYGLHQSLATYSGGLGVLSGDHCKSASDLGVPLVAVGLLYRNGYFKQTIDAEGQQQHIFPDYDFTRLPLRPVATVTGREVRVSVPLPGRDVQLKLWLAQIGRVPLLLLDTHIPENDPSDQPICDLLYVRGREMRFVQELILGIGGVRALDALGIRPSAWHLNEGHCALLQLERLREMVRDEGLDLDIARERLARNAVFTTHTPVPAGNEQFAPELVEKYCSTFCDEVGLGIETLQELGRAHEDDGTFNLTALAIKTTSWTNGVSRLNAEVASGMWRHLFPAELGERPIHPITNGVHTPSWIGLEIEELFVKYVGPNWRDKLLEPAVWEAIRQVPDEEIRTAHEAQKKRLGRFTRRLLRQQLARHGGSPDELRAVDGFFDTEALTIGFARRFATYKRANLIFSDPGRLEAILTNDERPVQILFAGKAHPADRPGQRLIQHIFELSKSEVFAGRVFFLENYDFLMGRMLVQGVDVWLNTPRKPHEASGTSGQKAGANGALNFSILDGWWPEGYNGKNGWTIGPDDPPADPGEQDWQDAQGFYDCLEHEILPLFYDRGDDGSGHGSADGPPGAWIERMKEAIVTLTPQFSALRMVRDYVEAAYLPAIRRGLGEG